MTTSLKDVSSAQMIHSLIEMNCFAEECNVHGYMWRDSAGHIKYTVGDDEVVIRRSFENKILENYEMSPIKTWGVHEIIKEETKEELWMYLKLRLCEMLRSDFKEEYFQFLHELSMVPADDQAWDILYPWFQEIDGYYDEEALQLFEGAVRYAVVTRHLKRKTYRKIEQWVQKTRSRIIYRAQVKDNYERSFSGFAYEKSAKQYVFFYNANQKAVFDRQKELEQRGIFYTPLYTKQYWYHSSGDLKAVKTRFQDEMKQLMDDEYLMRIDALRSLIHEELTARWVMCLSKAKERHLEAAVKGLLYWGYRWNIDI